MFEVWNAVKEGDIDRLLTLIESGAPIDVKDDLGKSLLHYAAEKGDIAIVQALLDAKADRKSTRLNSSHT